MATPLNVTEKLLEMSPSCEFDCNLNQQDRLAADNARKEHTTLSRVIATENEAQISERCANCLGPVVVKGVLECGVLHGNTRTAKLSLNL